MAAVTPPGEYEVVVVGSGPGGLQTSYYLTRYGVRHALLSADEAPGGMFRRWPIYERLISWTRLHAPHARETREYEWYDHNSLLAEEPEHRATVPALAGVGVFFPTRNQMEAGLAAFAERTGVEPRYSCRWERTRREKNGWLLETSDGEYRCRAVVFALGVTMPWTPPALAHVPHYAETREARAYQGKRVVIIGKRNSGFELAAELLPYARSIVLVSPQPVQTAVVARSTFRVRYFQPFEDHARGGGTFVLDGAVQRVEPAGEGYRVHVEGTTRPGALVLEADAVIAATGFRAPLGDLPEIGLSTVAQGRVPALTPFWESISLPGVYFAGNASDGAPALNKRGAQSMSTSVLGFRYNARLLAHRLAGRSDVQPIDRDAVVPLLVRAWRSAPELWAQRGYLARVVTLDGFCDAGVEPLAHFVDAAGPDAVAVTVETDPDGTILPVAYVRRDGTLREERFEPDVMHAFDAERYRRDLALLLAV